MNMQLSYPREEYLHPPHTACPGCSIPMALRYFLKAMGEKAIFIMPVGCSGVIIHLPTRRIGYQGQLMKVLSVPYGSTATFAGGVKTALAMRGDTETEVVAWAGDGATFDIGFQALSAAAERNEDIIYVCCDNEGYMNTGNQKSSATPRNVITSTTPLPVPKYNSKKDIALVLAAHYVPYVCTLTIAYPDDFIRKVHKAKGMKGFRFLHVLAPCPTGWRFPSESTVKISRLAVETKVFPLFEVENGIDFTINVEPGGAPFQEYVRNQRRYGDLTTQQEDELQEEAEQRWLWLKWLARYKKES